MRVLVTGGAGFIGAYVMEALAAGHEALAYDRSDGDDVRLLTAGDLQMMRVDHVIHLAGVLGTSELFAAPYIAVDVNVNGTIAVLEACVGAGAGFTGITMPASPWRNLYAATKGCAVHIAEAYHREYGLPVSHVRAFNAFGPGQAHGPGHPQKIIPTFAVKAWRGEPIPVWGSGEQTVDLVHARDLGRMLADAIAFGDCAMFDGGTGIPLTVSEVARMVIDAAGGTGGIEFLPMRPGETKDTRICATGEGWDVLGWRPEFREADLADTIRSYRP